MFGNSGFQDLFGYDQSADEIAADIISCNIITGLDADIITTDSAFIFKNTPTQIILEPGNRYSIQSANPAANRVLSLGDPGADSAFVFTHGAQELFDKTLTNASINSLASLDIIGNLTVGSDLLYVDTINRTIGIGNSGPQSVLDITEPVIAAYTDRVYGSSMAATPLNGNARIELITVDGSNSDITFVSHLNNQFSMIRGHNSSPNQSDLRFWVSRNLAPSQPYSDANLGTPTMILTNDGRLSLGNSSPSGALQIGNGNQFIVANDNSGISQLGTHTTNTPAFNTRITVHGVNSAPYAGSIHYVAENAGKHVFKVGGILDAMTIDSFGNIGVNTGTPTAQLTIANSTGPATMNLVVFGADTLALGVNQSASQLGTSQATGDACISAPAGKRLFFNNGTGGANMIINDVGNIGIANTGPTERLDVNGGIKIRNGNVFYMLNNTGSAYTQFAESPAATGFKSYYWPLTAPPNDDSVLISSAAGDMAWSNLNTYNKRVYAMIGDGTTYTNSNTTTILSNGTISGSKTIPGNSIIAGDTFHFAGCGVIKFLNNAQLVFNVDYGGYNIFQALLNFTPTLTALNTFIIDIYVTFRTVGASSSTMAWGSFNCNDSTHGYDFNVRLFDAAGPSTTTNKDLNIDATWNGTPSASNSIQLLSLICDRI